MSRTEWPEARLLVPGVLQVRVGLHVTTELARISLSYAREAIFDSRFWNVMVTVSLRALPLSAYISVTLPLSYNHN